MPEDKMTQGRASEILRRIVPWALERNSSTPAFKSNYKGVRGRIGIVGGARDYAGAPYFSSISAMRLGADLSYVICSRAAGQAIKNYSPDLIVTPLLDSQDESEFQNEMECLLSKLHALVIGPGLGREKMLQLRAKKLIQNAKARSLPLVLDADSLILVNDDPSIIKSYPKALLTPNRIELQRMLNSLYAPISFDLKNMALDDVEKLVKKCSTDLNVTILAKGMVDIIVGSGADDIGLTLKTDPMLGSDRRCGGQGDILAGLASVYLHWIEQSNSEKSNVHRPVDNPTVWAAYFAAITTRHCNELAYKEFHNGMLASHMIDKVHVAIDLLLSKGSLSISDKPSPVSFPCKVANYTGSLSQDEINRYKRQMIMEEFGPERQTNLRKASAIIIGAGGLGCPAAVYLGAGGIGRLGIVDDDKVEASNLHRQILHNLKKIGMLKTESIKEAILAINPNVQVVTHSVKMTRENAVQLIEDYDIVIDATDNLLTRYMISDACVVAKKPLVSGAALKMDGQLTVYNYDEKTPCFRCLFPEPPPPNAVGSCSDNGVLGVVPGIIGVHQALETLKIGAGLKPAYAGKMLLFDGQLGLFRHITIGKRNPNCIACGHESKLDRNLIDYEEFCGSKLACKGPGQANDILESNRRVSVEEYKNILESERPHVLVDVRPLSHSGVSKFAHALQIPVAELMQHPEESLNQIKQALETENTSQIFVVCRRGIASQRGCKIIQDMIKEDSKDSSNSVIVKDIVGGMTAWAEHVDPSYSCL